MRRVFTTLMIAAIEEYIKTRFASFFGNNVLNPGRIGRINRLDRHLVEISGQSKLYHEKHFYVST